jgi:hypothetical protein
LEVQQAAMEYGGGYAHDSEAESSAGGRGGGGAARPATLVDAAEQAIAWGESIQASAKKQLKSLIAIPGWDLKPGRKMKSWTDEKRASEILRDRPEAWSLKSPSAVSKLGVDLTDLVTEKISEPSLTRV